MDNSESKQLDDVSAEEARRFTFVAGWDTLATVVHDMAREKGWWDEHADIKLARELVSEKMSGIPLDEVTAVLGNLSQRNDAEMICLMHSELSEALEGLRHGNPMSEKIPPYSNVEEEMADVVIRMMDMCKARGWDVAGAVATKINMNAGRSYKHGGKRF